MFTSAEPSFAAFPFALPHPVGAHEFRRRPRLSLTLPGRYMTPDGGEYDCTTLDVSATGVLLKAAVRPAREARVIAYIRDLGRIEGEVVRYIAGGFALALQNTQRKEQRLASRIGWILRKGGEAVERRILPRLEMESAFVDAQTGGAGELVVELLDISATGVAFRTGAELRIGERVTIGNQTGSVARLFEGGAAVGFL